MENYEEHFMDLGSCRMFYRTMGKGRPLILLHGGWATGKLNWSHHYETLSKHFTIFSPDHRGHGKTNNPAGKFNSYRELAWELISFTERLNLKQKPLVIGHSEGAIISLFISIFQPDLLAAQVLVGIHGNISKSEKYIRGMKQFFGTSDYHSPPSTMDYMIKHPIRSLALWQAHKIGWINLIQQAWPLWVRTLELQPADYKKISIPTLILAGSEDEFGSLKDFEEFRDLIPGSLLRILDGENHMFVIDKPNLLGENALPFLSKIP